jgi:hypothetical protein
MIDRIRAALGRSRRIGSEDDEARIRREGHVGRAIVLSVVPLWTERNGRVESRLGLDVLLPRHRRFRTEIVAELDSAGRERVRVGAVVPIAADLAELGHVVLDLEQLAVNQEAVEALGPVAGGPGGPVRPRSGPGPEDER